MKNFSALLLALAFTAFACSPKTAPTASQKPAPAVPKVSYAAEVSTLIQAKCAPCHFPSQQGKKEPLDSQAALQKNINDVIARVELPQDDPKFMPFKLKKPALTAAEIALLKNWAKGGFSN
ncbi:MAG: hypothetical protein ABMA02_03195 [Saprospiraceae bacterium]